MNKTLSFGPLFPLPQPDAARQKFEGGGKSRLQEPESVRLGSEAGLLCRLVAPCLRHLVCCWELVSWSSVLTPRGSAEATLNSNSQQ